MMFGTLKDFIWEGEDENDQPVQENTAGEEVNGEIVLFAPRTVTDIGPCASAIIMDKVAVINLEWCDEPQRVIDFMSGIVCGLHGQIKRLNDSLIICSPKALRIENAPNK